MEYKDLVERFEMINQRQVERNSELNQENEGMKIQIQSLKDLLEQSQEKTNMSSKELDTKMDEMKT